MNRKFFNLQLFALNVTVTADSTLVSGTADDDTIRNNGWKVTINSGAGNDSISNTRAYARIDAGDGSDTVDNSGYDVRINGGAGDDLINSSPRWVTIDAGDGNDTIVGSADGKISAGAGNDLIYTNFGHMTIDAGTGDDTLISNRTNTIHEPFGSNVIQTAGNLAVSIVGYDDTIQTASALKSSTTSGNTMTFTTADNHTVKILDTTNKDISVIDGKIFVDKAVDTVNVGSKEYGNYDRNRVIVGTSGNDTIYNSYYNDSSSNVTIDADAGNDYIYNSGNKVTIDGGAGNDTISNSGSNVTIYGGDGNDTISSYSGSAGSNATINAGVGDDIVSLNSTYAANRLIQYADGEGNDTVYGLTSSDIIQISGSVYTTQKSGSDLLVNVGDGSILLKDVKSANIVSDKKIIWTVSGTTATGKVDGKQVAKITGLKKGATADDLSDAGGTITISNNALGTAKVTLTNSKGYAYKLAVDDDIKSVTTPAHWNIEGPTATYRSKDVTKGYVVATNGLSVSYVSKATVSKVLTTIEGLSENVTADDLTLSGKVVTINENALGTDTATISNGYTFKLDTDVTKSTTTKAFWTIDDDSAEYTTAKVTEGYVLSKDKKSITHNDAGGGEMVATIDGLKKGTKANAFSVKNNVITVANTALNPKNIITLDSEDYTLAIGGGAKKSVTSPEGWYISGTTASYNTEKTTAGYALFDDSKTIEYISEVDGGDTLVKLTGLKARTKATSLSIEKKVVTIGEDAINVKTAMTATAEGYEIKLSSAGKITAKSENMTLTGSSGNDTLLGSKYADVLKGGTGEDYLSGGNGADKIYGDGDDTLIGGLGKDSLYSTAGDNTLTGGSGADEFYFKAGNAIITDYTAGTDKIYLQGTSITKTEVDGKNVVFSTDNGGTITVKNGKNKKITVDDVTQKYSASSSGLFAEDNFVTADNLSQLVENNSVGEFEFNSSEKLSQENLITFAEK